MREYLTADDICNQMSMMRTVHDGTFLIVEGITDKRLYGKFTDDSQVKIVIAHSKENVRNSTNTMFNRRGDGGVLGIMDADLDRLRRKTPSEPLFHSDYRDMEMMVIHSGALDDLLVEYGDDEHLQTFVERIGPVRDAIVNSSYPIGLLMYISQRDGLNLKFRDLDFNTFINPRTLGLDARKMVSEVISNSENSRASEKDLLVRLNEEARDLDDVWKAARGHDTVKILLIGLKRIFGSFNSKGLNEGSLGGALRLAFTDSDFQKTDVFTRTAGWAEAHGLKLWSDLS